ncbi:hypothetical protein [Nocardioides sambongensis]|uniref:hypothetical protein n=1 Tax=Nocardioides sambongensis TaxID=2589074 RepID=UPI00112B83E8|nr:hypothetical protein [Nocardioides sambongensis]
MRHLRILTGLLAAIAMTLVALTAAPAANADRSLAAAPSSTTAAERSTSERAAKPAHVFKRLEAGNTKRRNVFYVAGKVTTFKGKVKLQKAGSKKGNYRTFKAKKVNRQGAFKIVFSAPVGTHLRVLVPGTKFRRTTTKYVGSIVRR